MPDLVDISLTQLRSLPQYQQAAQEKKTRAEEAWINSRIGMVGDNYGAVGSIMSAARMEDSRLADAMINDYIAGRDPKADDSDTFRYATGGDGGFWENIDRSFGRAVGGLVEQAGAAGSMTPVIKDLASVKEFEQKARLFAAEQRLANQPLLSERQIQDLEDWSVMDDFFDPAWVATEAAESVFQSLPLIATGVAAAPLAAGGGAIAAGAVAGSVGALGGMQVAAETYNDLRRQGYSREQAGAAARRVLGPAFVSGAAGGAVGGAILSKAGQKLTPMLAKGINKLWVTEGAKLAGSVGAAGTIEGSQELYELAVQKAGEEWIRQYVETGKEPENGWVYDGITALPEPFGIFTNPTKEEKVSFLLGAVMGIAIDAPPAIAQSARGIVSEYEAGIIGDDEGIARLAELRDQLRGLSGEELRGAAQDFAVYDTAGQDDTTVRQRIFQAQAQRLSEGTSRGDKSQPSERVEGAAMKSIVALQRRQQEFMSPEGENLTEDRIVKVDAVDPVNEQESNFVSLVERITGKPVQLVQATVGGNAVRMTESGVNDNNAILIDVESERTVSEILAHELVHSIKQQNPQAFDALAKAAMKDKAAVKGWLDRYNAIRESVGQKPLAAAEALSQEEFVADFVGQYALDPNFVENIANNAPAAFEQVATESESFLRKLWKGLKGEKAKSPVIREQVTEARANIEKVLGDFVQAETELQRKPVGSIEDTATEEQRTPPPRVQRAGAVPLQPRIDLSRARRRANEKVPVAKTAEEDFADKAMEEFAARQGKDATSQTRQFFESPVEQEKRERARAQAEAVKEQRRQGVKLPRLVDPKITKALDELDSATENLEDFDGFVEKNRKLLDRLDDAVESNKVSKAVLAVRRLKQKAKHHKSRYAKKRKKAKALEERRRDKKAKEAEAKEREQRSEEARRPKPVQRAGAVPVRVRQQLARERRQDIPVARLRGDTAESVEQGVTSNTEQAATEDPRVVDLLQRNEDNRNDAKANGVYGRKGVPSKFFAEQPTEELVEEIRDWVGAKEEAAANYGEKADVDPNVEAIREEEIAIADELVTVYSDMLETEARPQPKEPVAQQAKNETQSEAKKVAQKVVAQINKYRANPKNIEQIGRVVRVLAENGATQGTVTRLKQSRDNLVRAIVSGGVADEATGRLATLQENFGRDVNAAAQEVAQALRGGEASSQVYNSLNREMLQSPEFKRWFGDSKVVDGNGDPLVVYHGTLTPQGVGRAQEPFYAFDDKKLGKSTATPIAKLGHYFTPQRQSAEQYAFMAGMKDFGEERVIEVYLSLQNPLRVPFSVAREFMNYGSLDDQQYKTAAEARKAAEAFRDKAVADGHDGIIFESNGEGVEYVAFSPTQIKSVDNRGTFDPADPDIRNSLSRPVDWDQISSPEFRRWFDGSKIVHKLSGIPKVMYHGTVDEIRSFESGKKARNNRGNPAGFYFTEFPEEAENYTRYNGDDGPSAGANIVPAYLSIKNPYPMANATASDVNQAMLDQFAKELREANKYLDESWVQSKVKHLAETGSFPFIDFSGKRKTRVLQAGGYDGIIDGEHHAVAFEPTQIKSVYNRGTFDPADPDIRYSLSRQLVSSRVEGVTFNPSLEIATSSYTAAKRAKGYGGVNREQEIRLSDMSDKALENMLGAMETARKQGHKGYQALPKKMFDKRASVRKRADVYIQWMRKNLNALYNRLLSDPKYGKAFVERSALWYDGANRIAHEFSDRYGYKVEQIAAAMANLSPQKDWFMNVNQAELLISVVKHDMDKKVFEGGKSLRDLYESMPEKGQARKDAMLEFGLAVRKLAFDLGRQNYSMILPEGTPYLDAPTKTAPDVAQKSSWGSGSEMYGAVSVLLDGSLENISKQVGAGHKVRSFYNNIVSPWSDLSHVTIDTHAIGAAHLLPVSASTPSVFHNFGNGIDANKAKDLGVPVLSSAGVAALGQGYNGTYVLAAEAYRLSAGDLNWLPRQLQSITWEAIRAIYPADTKTDALLAEKEQKWRNDSEDDARFDILNHRADPPFWMGTPADRRVPDSNLAFRGEEGGAQADQRPSLEFVGGRGTPSQNDSTFNSYANATNTIALRAGVSFIGGKKPQDVKNLAIPARTQDYRDFSVAVQQAANELNKPTSRPRQEIVQLADLQLQSRYNGDLDRLARDVRTGALKHEDPVVETELFIRAIRHFETKGSLKNPAVRRQFVEALLQYRDQGAETARALNYRRDHFQTPAERAKHYMLKLLNHPSPDLEAKWDRAKQRGDKKAQDRVVDEIVALQELIKEELQLSGLDPDNLKPTDPKTVSEVGRVIEGVNASINPLRAHNAIHEYFVNAILWSPKTLAANVLGAGYGIYELGLNKSIALAVTDMADGGKAIKLNKNWMQEMGIVSKAVLGNLDGFWETLTNSFKYGVDTHQMRLSPELVANQKQASQFDTGRRGGQIQGVGRRFARFAGGKSKKRRARIAKATDGMARLSRVSTDAIVGIDAALRFLFYKASVAWTALETGKAAGLTGAELEAQVKRMMDEPTSVVSKNAIDVANELLFQNRDSLKNTPVGFLADGILKAKSLDQKKHGILMGAIGAVARQVFPFITTPANLIRIGVARLTPYALMDAAKGANTLIRNDSEWVYNNRAEAGQAIVNGAVVSGVWALGATIALAVDDDGEPVITGSGPFDPLSTRARFGREAAPPQSIRVGNNWYSYARLDPLATPLALLIDSIRAYELAQTDQERSEILGDFAGRVAGQMNEKVMLRQIGEIAKVASATVRGESGYGKAYATNLVTSYTPAFIRHVNLDSDQLAREHSTSLDVSMIKRVKQRTARFTEETALPKRDWLGRVRTKSNGEDFAASTFLARLVSPSYVVNSPDAELNSILINWNDMNLGNREYFPTFPRKSMRINDEKVELTPEEYDDLLSIRGERIRKKWGFVRKVWKIDPNNPTEEDMEKIKKLVDREHRKTREIIKRRVEKRIASP